MTELTAYDRFLERQRTAEKQHIERALFQAQTAAIALAHKVKVYEDALGEIAWSNDSEWQQDRAKQVLAQMRGVEL
jgi:pimeloyl-CoA synthetase